MHGTGRYRSSICCRLDFITMNIKATQLFGCSGAHVSWRAPEHVPPPAPLWLAPADTRTAALCLPLPSLPNEFPETDNIT